jgi:hypothetical protein
MQVDLYIHKNSEWDHSFDSSLDSPSTLVLIFASLHETKVEEELSKIAASFPHSIIIGASTSGEIYQEDVFDDTIVVSVSKFESTKLNYKVCESIGNDTSYEDGATLANELYTDTLKGIFILSDGLLTNGSKLTRGVSSVVNSSVVVSGGLAGDKDKFEKTWIIEKGSLRESVVCAVGFYGENIHFEAASKGGWDSLGLSRTVTKSKDNVLYELDGKPALEIYKRYLGDKAKELPASGLLFPLELREGSDNQEKKVRTVLGVDESNQSITFAGNIPQNSEVTLMKANFNRLVDGAGKSAEALNFSNFNNEPLLCIAISCVGRKLLLKSRTDEEIEAVKEILPENANLIGFYSYGEISPLASGRCDLHNQTMTLTAIWESDA